MRGRLNERKVGGIIIVVIICAFAFSGIVMFLWNALLPVIFHLPVIGLWQAMGLLLLSKILFGRFGGRPRFGWRKDNLRQAWVNMDADQKEKFKQEWSQRCGKRYRGETPFGPKNSGMEETGASKETGGKAE